MSTTSGLEGSNSSGHVAVDHERTRPSSSAPGRRKARLGTKASGPSREVPGSRWLTRWGPYVAAALAVVWVYRTVIFGDRLPGNTGDARWSIAVYDHWYRVWQGLDGVRDLLYYYPLKRTLGTSDAYFVQGQFYSLGRVLGLGVVNAWVAATLVFALIGAIGVAALSQRLFLTSTTRIAFVLLSLASYPAVAGLGHVQLVGFSAGSWVVLGLLDIRAGRTLRGVTLVGFSSFLIALSSWYAIVLLGVVLAFLWLTRLIFVGDCKGLTAALIKEVLASLWSTRGVVVAAITIAGWLATAWIYLPGSALLPRPPWSEAVIYSPRWSDIWNASGGGGGLWGPFYDRLYPATSTNIEQQFGFTPVVFVALCACVVVFARRGRSSRATGSPPMAMRARTAEPHDTVLAAALTCAVSIAFFLVDERGLGFFHPVWSLVPGMTSIRAPFRVMLYLYPLAFFSILRTGEVMFAERRSLRRNLAAGLALLVVAGMFIEMQRPQGADWSRAGFLSSTLSQDVSVTRRDCDAVFIAFDEPSVPITQTLIDAVIVSVESGVPTPQGFSRGVPTDYPANTQSPFASLEWMRQHGFQGRLCVISDQGIRRSRPTS